jgi:hypothetical protein
MSQHYDPQRVGSELRKHSYLARSLQDSLAGQNQYQIDTLGYFLRAAYPDGLTRQDIGHIMVGTGEPLTLPFLAAVLLMVASPDDACVARELFVYNSFISMDLESATSRELEKLVLAKVQEFSAAAPLKRKVSAPLPPDDPADAPTALTDLPPPADNAQQTEGGGRHRVGTPRKSPDGP